MPQTAELPPSVQEEDFAFPWSHDASASLCTGMTLRDWFAGQWLASCASSGAFDKTDAKEIAEEAYAYADAMMVERKLHNR